MTSPLSVLSRVRPPISRGVPARRPRTPDVRATSPVLSTSFAFVLGAGVTALILFTEWFPAGYRAGALSAQVNTVDGCIALLVAYLSHGRFGRDRRIRYRLIGHGLAVFGAAALLLPVVAQLLPQQAPGAADTWASAVIRLTGTGLIAAGALARDSVIDYRRPRWAVAAVPAIALAVPLALFRAIAPALPPALIPVGATAGRMPLVFTSHPVFAALQLAGAVCFLVAAVALTGLAVRRPGDLIGTMGPAFALGTFALIQYALFPTLTTGFLYSGDVLRTASYALLLTGAAIEIRRYWTGQSRVAVLEDRRRLAREIHDGVVQEVAYIRMETESLGESEGAARIVDACDRALDEARDAVHALALSNDEPLEHLLQRAAHDLSRRHAIDVDLRLADVPRLDADQRYALVRIVREAVTNAARHGGGRAVVVELARHDGHRVLEIRDDGRGFDPGLIGATAGGYGLVSMRERADALPGRCVVDSVPGSGTTVRVTW